MSGYLEGKISSSQTNDMTMSYFQPPPHGSWKPSINLSSCLTSLQVLMSEPNPDDPLMPEMAEQLRYNRDKVSSRFYHSARQSVSYISYTCFKWSFSNTYKIINSATFLV